MEFKFNEERKNLINFSFLKDEGEFFKGELGQALPTSKGEILLGLGDGDEFDKNKLKKTVYDLLGSYKNIKTLSIPENKLGLDDKDYVLAIVEAALAASYEFDYYKKEKNKLSLEAINFDKNLEKYQDDLNELVNIIDGQNLAKDLVNLRSNDIYPESLAKISSDELSKLGVNVKVYGKEEIHDLGLSAFLEVAKGSERDPKFIVMEYLKGEDSEKPFVFVGKGLTYDSGGYSLKSSNGMKTMNSDMGGAGTVIGAMKAIAKNKLKKNVVAIVAACENLLSGKAYKPGDVIRARNKMTIEVDNTDAEGRITLADAVNYGSSEYSPKIIIDLATLTGAVLSALGETYTGALTNDKIGRASCRERV